MATKAQLEAWLVEAETAKHKIVTNQQAVNINYNGRSVQYSQSNLADLNAYIRDLKTQINGGRGKARQVYF